MRKPKKKQPPEEEISILLVMTVEPNALGYSVIIIPTSASIRSGITVDTCL